MGSVASFVQGYRQSKDFKNDNSKDNQEKVYIDSDVDPIEFFQEKQIDRVDYCDNNIKIYFDNEDEHLLLSAIGDCCSSSWFEFENDINEIIGHRIVKIIQNGATILHGSCESVESSYSDDLKEYTKETIETIEILFDDDSSFDFCLRNSSNGYYSGWLQMDIIQDD